MAVLKLRIQNDLLCFDNSVKKRQEDLSGNRIPFADNAVLHWLQAKYVFAPTLAAVRVHASRRIFVHTVIDSLYVHWWFQAWASPGIAWVKF